MSTHSSGDDFPQSHQGPVVNFWEERREERKKRRIFRIGEGRNKKRRETILLVGDNLFSCSFLHLNQYPKRQSRGKEIDTKIIKKKKKKEKKKKKKKRRRRVFKKQTTSHKQNKTKQNNKKKSTTKKKKTKKKKKEKKEPQKSYSNK